MEPSNSNLHTATAAAGQRVRTASPQTPTPIAGSMAHAVCVPSKPNSTTEKVKQTALEIFIEMQPGAYRTLDAGTIAKIKSDQNPDKIILNSINANLPAQASRFVPAKFASFEELLKFKPTPVERHKNNGDQKAFAHVPFRQFFSKDFIHKIESFAKSLELNSEEIIRNLVNQKFEVGFLPPLTEGRQSDSKVKALPIGKVEAVARGYI